MLVAAIERRDGHYGFDHRGAIRQEIVERDDQDEEADDGADDRLHASYKNLRGESAGPSDAFLNGCVVQLQVSVYGKITDQFVREGFEIVRELGLLLFVLVERAGS